MQSGTKVGIVTGVVSSLLVLYLVDPVLKLLGAAVYYSVGWISAGFWDSLYVKAALGVPKDAALTIFSLGVGGFVGGAIGVSTAIIKNHRKSLPGATLVSGANGRGLDTQVIPRPVAIIGFLMVSYALLMLSYAAFTYNLQHGIITSFDQHVRIIAPYIEGREKEMLVSEFARMQSESDYLRVYEKINKIANENDLILPDNPSYNFWAL